MQPPIADPSQERLIHRVRLGFVYRYFVDGPYCDIRLMQKPSALWIHRIHTVPRGIVQRHPPHFGAALDAMSR